MLNNPIIIVGTDFSPQSDLALKAADSLCKLSKGELHLVHVAPYPFAWDWITNDAMINYLPGTFKQDLMKELNTHLDKQVERCKVKCIREIFVGPPLKALNETIKTQGANMLVVGHHGAGASQYFIGGLTTKLVSSCEVPLLVIQKPLDVKKVAGLVDTQYPMSNIFSTSEELSFLFSAELQFTSVWQDVLPDKGEGLKLTSLNHLSYTIEERKNIIAAMESFLREKMDPHSKAKVDVTIAHHKKVSEALRDKLMEDGVDLAVLTRHRRNAIEKMFIGSLTRTMLDTYDGNLLILPPKEKLA